MKKIITLLIIGIIITMFGCVYATDTFELEFKTIDNKKEEKFDLYILLPEEYITFAIKEANLNIIYDGANTLKTNTIPGIEIEKEKVKNDVYYDNGIEYVQILLKANENGKYQFDLLEDYPKMNIKYRIKNEKKDYIVHIDNFKVEKGKCEIEYNYRKDIVKQPDKKVIPTGVKILVILLIIVIIVGMIARLKTKKDRS